MAVIFAVVGGAIVIGGATYSDHSDHSDYSDYDNYSDAAERKRRRIEALKQETESSARDLAGYKRDEVNPNLSSTRLKQAPAMTVSREEMDQDAQSIIKKKVEKQIQAESGGARVQIDEINRLLARIEEIQKEESDQ